MFLFIITKTLFQTVFIRRILFIRTYSCFVILSIFIWRYFEFLVSYLTLPGANTTTNVSSRVDVSPRSK